MEKTQQLTKMSIVAAFIFLLTYFIKIPSLNGYTHLGDCMILLGVLLLGSKRGALAGGVGAALADLLGGYMQWIFPTFFIKIAMALTMGLFIEKLFLPFRYNWLLGAFAGGFVQILGYTAVKILYYGFLSALMMTPGLFIQTFASIVLTAVFITAFKNIGLLKTVKE